MTEANRSMEELPAILEERRKYESWLAALDARRDSTPKHVFERVKTDYEGRLRRVESEIAAHRHAIQEERASLASRVSLLEADEQLRRDERAELELRVHVGELAGEAAEASFSTVDESLAEIVGEKEELTKKITDLDQLLEIKPQPAPSTSPATATASTPTPAATQPVEQSSTTLAETTPISMEPIPGSSAEAAPAPSAPTTTSNPSVAEARNATPASVASEAEAMAAETATREADRDPRRTPGGTFDELAFLSDLVGDGTRGKTPIRNESADSLLAGLGNGPRRSGEAPLGSNVPGHTPIALRVSGAIEQVKTLKCTECGGMNYPTEWYCERCGAELAAL